MRASRSSEGPATRRLQQGHCPACACECLVPEGLETECDTHVHTRAHTQTHEHTHVCVHVHNTPVHTCTGAHTCTQQQCMQHTCTRMLVHTHTYTHTQTASEETTQLSLCPALGPLSPPQPCPRRWPCGFCSSVSVCSEAASPTPSEANVRRGRCQAWVSTPSSVLGALGSKDRWPMVAGADSPKGRLSLSRAEARDRRMGGRASWEPGAGTASCPWAERTPRGRPGEGRAGPQNPVTDLRAAGTVGDGGTAS